MSGARDGSREVTEDMLLAYADGQLSAADRVSVEAWLIQHPERAAEVGLWQRQNAALNTLYGPVATEAVPPRLAPHRIAGDIGRRRREGARIAAAIALVIGLSGSAGWLLRTATWQEEPASGRLIDGAMTAHSLFVKESRHAVEVTADDKSHLVTWLSNRVGHAIGTPDLSPQGFELIGGRLLPPPPETGPGPAAQLMYQDGTANRVTVYITAARDGDGKPYAQYDEKGLQAYYWADDQITCTVVGGLPQAEMQQVAKDVYQQLTWRPDPGGRT